MNYIASYVAVRFLAISGVCTGGFGGHYPINPVSTQRFNLKTALLKELTLLLDLLESTETLSVFLSSDAAKYMVATINAIY